MIQALTYWYNEAEAAHMIAARVADTIRRVTSFVKAFAKLPDKVIKVVQVTKFLGTIGLVFQIVNLKRNIQAIQTANNTIDRIKSVAKTLVNCSTIHYGVVNTVDVLKAVGAIEKNSNPWTQVTPKIFYPLGLLNCGLSIRQLYETALLYKEMKQNLSAKRIDASSEYIKANEKKLKGRLNIATDIKAQSTDPEVIKGLKTRITTQLALTALSTALKVAGIITLGISLFIVSSPVILGVTAIISILTLLHFADDRMTNGRDLIPKPLQTWRDRIVYHVRTTTEQAAKKIEKVVKNAISSF